MGKALLYAGVWLLFAVIMFSLIWIFWGRYYH